MRQKDRIGIHYFQRFHDIDLMRNLLNLQKYLQQFLDTIALNKFEAIHEPRHREADRLQRSLHQFHHRRRIA